jgi:hypothetical protein
VTNIRPNPTSGLGRSVGYLRWGGRALIVVGIGVTAYRLGTATEEELPRVIGEEAGGWAGGFAGAALAGAGCVALGVATGGIALLLCGLAGGIAGGIGGSALGGAIGEDIGRGGGSTTLRGFDSPMFNCFTADMPVLLADRTRKPIGEVAVGDRILSWHEESEQVREGTVARVFARPPQPFLDIELEEGPPISVTAYHHLWVSSLGREGWMEAGALRPGDELFAPVGAPARLVPRKVRRITARPAGPAVYDLSVEPTHTYFAGGILAHNKLP